MTRFVAMASLLLLVLACKNIDHLLEGPAPVDARLSMAVDSVYLTVPKGAARTLDLSVTRIGNFTGPVTLTIEQLPAGVTATVSNESTVGAVTNARVSLAASSTAAAASFVILLRAHADKLTDATAQFTLTVTPPLDFVLAASMPTSAVARGGQAVGTVSVTRTNFGAPITLSLDGDVGISASFAENPLTVSSTTARIVVGSSTAAGTYAMRWRARGDGVPDRTVPFSLTVTADSLQLLATPALSVAQAGRVQTPIIVNRIPTLAAPTLSLESLPVGVTGNVAPIGADGTSTITFVAGPDAVPGLSRITVRARVSGVSDATTELALTVLSASIALSLSATTLDVFQGATARVAATVTRSAYVGGVSFALENAPVGLTVVATPDAVNGTLTSLALSADGSTPTGTYALTVRAQPDGLSANAARRSSLTVTVRPASADGNVLLDWSTCDVPTWVAGQDGQGAWQPLRAVNGTFRFAVASTRGAFAYIEGGTTLVVQQRTRAELIDGPLNLCPPPRPTKTVYGVSEHTGSFETWTYGLGGAATQTTINQRVITLSGVASGRQDLVGWTPYANSFHALLRRDLDVPDGGRLDQPVSLIGDESFTVARTSMTIANLSNESVSHTMAYLTTAACTVNPLYSNGPHGTTPAVWGIPDFAQRPTDFHLLTVTATATASKRIVSTAFHTLESRTIDLPPLLPAPTVRALSGPSKRLEMVLGGVPTALNDAVEFRYGDGTRFVRLIASVAAAGTQNLTLSTPDFSAVGDFPSGLFIAPTATGSWTMTLTGATAPGARCQENRSSVTSQRIGTF